jgi:cold shock CspA family protein
MERETGTVVVYFADRGFGFCAPDGETDRDRNLFIAGAAVKRSRLASLDRGDKITYRREESQRRPGTFE